MRHEMNADEIEEGLRKVGHALDWPGTVEVLLVGGAAGLITGLLARGRTTIDCDVLAYTPANAWTRVEAAAEAVARELGFSPTWLNSDVQVRLSPEMLPKGWQDRRVLVGRYGKLHVFAVSRADLIALKFLAHRDRDLQDLEALGVTRDDVKFVRGYLKHLLGSGEQGENIRGTQELVDGWKTVDR